jgi:tetratricopeptide (TPR) repeat protein
MADPTMADPMMERITAAIALAQSGERAEAARAFEALWAEIGADGDPFHRCTLAHFMADVQDDPEQELLWDQRALAAADGLDDDRAQAWHPSLQVRGFYPSLHLNLAEDYRKLGRPEQARAHLEQATAALDALPDDGYGQLIRGGVARLAERLAG